MFHPGGEGSAAVEGSIWRKCMFHPGGEGPAAVERLELEEVSGFVDSVFSGG